MAASSRWSPSGYQPPRRTSSTPCASLSFDGGCCWFCFGLSMLATPCRSRSERESDTPSGWDRRRHSYYIIRLILYFSCFVSVQYLGDAFVYFCMRVAAYHYHSRDAVTILPPPRIISETLENPRSEETGLEGRLLTNQSSFFFSQTGARTPALAAADHSPKSTSAKKCTGTVR